MMSSLAVAPAPETEPPFMQKLNSGQRRAVEALEGPVLVLAGAGTGKTRVLTTRLAWLLYTGAAQPGQIMAVTFTNKAANEIRERVGHMLGCSTDGWYMGTFHALAARLLRPYAERVGLKSNFTILDDDDQIRLIKQLVQAHNLDDKRNPARLLHAVISSWKDKGLTPDKAPSDSGDLADGKLRQIYAEYQERLLSLNACDFGDLLLHHLTLCQKHPDVLSNLHARFKYMMVDEYQDTNVAQYMWLRLLAQGSNNLCVVGDEDQSIYGWRGAEVGNILRFADDFPGATVVRLEENYRSTGHILSAANGLIANNRQRLGKQLRAVAGMGDKVVVASYWDHDEEARRIAGKIEAAHRGGHSLAQMAIMVRAGSQTRAFEEVFLSLGIPYKVLVGARFYERLEIRDAMAYLRVLMVPEDDLAFERIINTPKRGIGPSAMQQLAQLARDQNIPLTESVLRLCETDELKPKMRQTLQQLMQSFSRWRQLLHTMPHPEVAQIVLDESGYTGMWQADKSPEAPGRLENLKELINAIGEFNTLPAFLEHVALVMERAADAGAEQVSMMTLHGAKGLEFDTVYLPGWEEEIFPSRRTIDEHGSNGLEEERRLAYVGITRGRKHVEISFVANRLLHGTWLSAAPSRFVAELPQEHVTFSHRPNAPRPQTTAPAPRNLFHQIRTQQGKPAAPIPKTPPTLSGTYQRVPITPKTETDKNQREKNHLGRVRHGQFGMGTIVAREGQKLDVRFDNGKTLKVMAGFVTMVNDA